MERAEHYPALMFVMRALVVRAAPLCGPKIGGVLASGSVLTAVPICTAARLMGRPLGPMRVWHCQVRVGRSRRCRCPFLSGNSSMPS